MTKKLQQQKRYDQREREITTELRNQNTICLKERTVRRPINIVYREMSDKPEINYLFFLNSILFLTLEYFC